MFLNVFNEILQKPFIKKSQPPVSFPRPTRPGRVKDLQPTNRGDNKRYDSKNRV